MDCLPDSEEVIKNLLKLDVTKLKPNKKYAKVKYLVSQSGKVIFVHQKTKHYTESVKVKRRAKKPEKRKEKSYRSSFVAKRK